ncbi:hypothetical protein [Oceanicella sp. SM1341]|uniref:hypothetical protein n=1 Tax=Oceanicella sp. SM1341 TaxID=1548889 RepID=UPI000E53DA12|nr:hypothetical protein [Oceanicella sp. SM1341]
MFRTLAFAALALFGATLVPPLAASAQDTPIPESEWRDLTRGKTVYYYIDGTYFGREYYWPGQDMVTFQHASGVCANARWTYSSGEYCFFFDRPHCFAHVRRDGEIIIIPQSAEAGGEQEQLVQSISPTSFTCTPGLTS